MNDFAFELPKELIAQRPAHPRDHARLLIYDRASKTITDDYFYNLQQYLAPNTTLVVNNSKVEKARLRFGRIEVFLVETVNNTTAKAMVRPGRRFKRDTTVELAPEITAKVIDIDDEGLRTLVFSVALDDSRLDPYRLTPLPPYIKQDESLADEYQTVYADPLGSKAAPTAGLHFTDDLLGKITKDHQLAEVTLHVGLGTFAPVRDENMASGSLHEEHYAIDEPTASLINQSAHVTAVGTTSARVLESQGKTQKAGNYATDIFIQPGYEFQRVDSLITNFHLPKSSLLMLVAAFMGYEEMMGLYAHAVKHNYRFYSFGDAMLLR